MHTSVHRFSALLLGTDSFVASPNQLPSPTIDCLEKVVLQADVHRTRSDVEECRSPQWQEQLSVVLQTFCLNRSVSYKQGMNEV
jgi:hypothetical protein